MLSAWLSPAALGSTAARSGLGVASAMIELTLEPDGRAFYRRLREPMTRIPPLNFLRLAGGVE
jgi:hypothetical protein